MRPSLRSSRVLCLAVSLLGLGSRAAGQPPPPPADVILEGVVYDEKTNTGMAGVTVRLILPRSEKGPLRVLRTDGNGNFCFREPDPRAYRGKFLVEVNNGTVLLFRRVIDTSRPANRRVRLPIKT